MEAVIAVIGGLVLRVMDLILDKIAKDVESKRRFMAFVESMSKNSASAAKLHLKYQAQLEKLRRQGEPKDGDST